MAAPKTYLVRYVEMDGRGRTTEKTRSFRSERARERHLLFLKAQGRLGMVLALEEE